MKSNIAWIFLALAAVVTAVLTYVVIFWWTPNNTQSQWPDMPQVEVYQDYPIIEDRIKTLSDGVNTIFIDHSVSQVSPTSYKYRIIVEYRGEGSVLFSWGLLDRIIGDPLEPDFIQLRTNEPQDFSFTSEESPVVYNSPAVLFVKTTRGWERTALDLFSGPLPPSNLTNPLPPQGPQTPLPSPRVPR